jgi:hypothetical protein
MVDSFDQQAGEPHPGTPRVLFQVAGLSSYDPIPGSRDFVVFARRDVAGVRVARRTTPRLFATEPANATTVAMVGPGIG